MPKRRPKTSQDLEKPVLQPDVTVCATGEAVEVASAALSTCQIIFIDCEGVELGVRGGSLCVLSLGGITPNVPHILRVYLIDVLCLSVESLRPVFDLIASSDMPKVFWDGRLDYSALYHDFGVQLCNTVDLQIVDVLSRASRDTPTRHAQRFNGYVAPGLLKRKDVKERYANVDRLNNLLRAVKEHKPIGYAHFNKKKVDHQVWGTTRPLPAEYIKYAAMDVEMIAALYQTFSSRQYITPHNLHSLSAKSARYISFWADRQPTSATRKNYFIGNAFLPLEVVDDISDIVPSIADGQKLQCRGCNRLLTLASFPPSVSVRAGTRKSASSKASSHAQVHNNCWVCIAVEENSNHWDKRSKEFAKRNARAAARATITKSAGSLSGTKSMGSPMVPDQQSDRSKSDSEADSESI